jgi:hypothetical protein
MIKRYLEFIKENHDEFNSIGEWVESLYEDDYVKNIVNRYIDPVSSDIRLSNAINLLDEFTQKEIKQQIEKYQQEGIEEKEPVISTSTDLETLTESEITKAGRGIFHSFLKTLTALGQKEKKSEIERCPDNFLLFYFYDNLEAEAVKQVFSRFQSLVPYLEHIDYGKNEVSLYFGVKCDGELEYGVSYDGNFTPFGSFKLNQTVIKWLNNIEAKSAFSLKKELVNLSYSDIIILGKVKSEMSQYNPGYHEKRLKPELRDRVMSFGYQGIGTWDNGKLDESELANLKNNFITWLLSKNWGSKVLISVKPSSYWLYIHIKLK